MEIPGWVFEAVRVYSGLDAALLSAGALAQAVEQRVRALALQNPAVYWPLLRDNEAELNSLVQALTNKETSFFREPRQFQALRDHVLPELLAGRRQEGEPVTLRLWSAGCATGEEAYSLAMTLLDYQHRTAARFEASVIGTDIDESALDHARQGCYEERAVRLAPEDVRQRYFIRKGGRWCVVPEVAGLVTFRAHNLAAGGFPAGAGGALPAAHVRGSFDVIFCRNVTIYFDEPMRERLNTRLAGLLREGGYLFVASAETLGHDRGRLSLVAVGEGFAFRKRTAAEEQGPSEARRLRVVQARPPAPTGTASLPQQVRATSRPHASAAPTTTKAVPKPGVDTRAPGGEHSALEAARRAFEEQSYDDGLRHLDQLPARGAAWPQAICLRAAILLQQARPEEANELCRSALDRDPWQPNAYLLLALGYRQQGHGAEAVDMLKQAVYLRPDDAQAHFFLGDTYRLLGLPAEARREYENTLNILERKGASPARTGARRGVGATPAGVGLSGVSDDLMRRACHAHLAQRGQHQASGG